MENADIGALINGGSDTRMLASDTVVVMEVEDASTEG